jgi:hypothetical protein
MKEDNFDNKPPVGKRWSHTYLTVIISLGITIGLLALLQFKYSWN